MRLLLRSLFLILLLPLSVWAAPDTTMTIAPSATSGTTITAADENDRNSDVSTAYNAHSHTDISQTANTLNVGDGSAGNKTITGNAADSSDRSIRWDDTADLWVIQQGSSTYNQIATMTSTTGLTAKQVVVADGTGALRSTTGGLSEFVLVSQAPTTTPVWQWPTAPPQADCTNHRGEGELCWDADANQLMIGTGGATVSAGSIVWKTTTSDSVDTSGTNDIAYTDLDLTSVTSPTARTALIRIQCNNTTAGEYVACSVRRNGDTPDHDIQCSAGDNLGAAGVGFFCNSVVGMDSNQVIEYSVDSEASATARIEIGVLGYWE